MKSTLDRVRIGAGLTSAYVDDREIVADGPKALRGALADALYDTFHTGHPRPGEAEHRSVRDPEFERLLRERVPHRDTAAVAPVEPGMPGVLRLNGVRVRVPESRLGDEVATPAGPARHVRLPAVRPSVSPGFLLAGGSAGEGLGEGGCLRVYLGAESAEAAPGLWGAVLERLELLRLPYRAKVLSARDLHPRRDSVVVYLGPSAWQAVPEIAAAARAAGGLREDRSAYVAPLGPGAGWAWEPDDRRPGMRGLSFGEHRSHAVAAGLLACAEHGGDRAEAVREALLAAGIDPDAPHRNLTSPARPFQTSGPEPGPGPREDKEGGDPHVH
ncbi:T3SS effector HopA1 family protein [Actinomadura sp. ATCC 31491]|uniref:T3SS effector HopA1 family protein n=1 Tax=Actinomadura luzonensis TaxID=2805427 RepID=A0ABT0FN38_9ACTN|nr:T3SS effector HopA1 family protein [Actinomadura luzonensis]MCK2213712.1 T3SS effector HopA1 family protein [Actinomadura luzonensis]